MTLIDLINDRCRKWMLTKGINAASFHLAPNFVTRLCSNKITKVAGVRSGYLKTCHLLFVCQKKCPQTERAILLRNKTLEYHPGYQPYPKKKSYNFQINFLKV